MIPISASWSLSVPYTRADSRACARVMACENYRAASPESQGRRKSDFWIGEERDPRACRPGPMAQRPDWPHCPMSKHTARPAPACSAASRSERQQGRCVSRPHPGGRHITPTPPWVDVYVSETRGPTHRAKSPPRSETEGPSRPFSPPTVRNEGTVCPKRGDRDLYCRASIS